MLKICFVHENFDLNYIATLGFLGLNVNFCFSIVGGGGGGNMETTICCSGPVSFIK